MFSTVLSAVRDNKKYLDLDPDSETLDADPDPGRHRNLTD